MNSTTDFQLWLDAVSGEDFETIFSLHQAVSTGSTYINFTVVPARGSDERFLVKWEYCDMPPLLIASEKAQDQFIKMLEAQTCDPGMSMMGWHAYMYMMSKED